MPNCGPNIVASATLQGQTSAISNTTLFSVPTDGTYRLSAYMNVPSGSLIISSTVDYVDADDSSTQPTNAPEASAGSPNGTVGVFRAKGGTDITYFTAVVSGSGTYDLYLVLENLQ